MRSRDYWTYTFCLFAFQIVNLLTVTVNNYFDHNLECKNIPNCDQNNCLLMACSLLTSGIYNEIISEQAPIRNKNPVASIHT